MNIIHPEDIQQLRHIYDSYRNKSLDVFQSEYRVKKKNGEWIWIIAHGAGIWTSKGELIKLLVTHMDITQRKEAEAKLQLMIKENENLLKRAIENEKIKSEFFCNISHEFRTPLNIILGVVQLFESNRKYLSDGSQSNNYIRILKQNCYRVLRLINNILEINKIDARYSELNLKNHNIIGLVEDIALSVTEFINNRGMSITFDTDMEERIIACDEYKIERIILNLLSNSIKYSKTDTQIFVNITNEKDFVNITVRDTGIGIQRDKIHTIFDRFTQVDSSLTRKCEGSGIGLSIVKSYVEMHGGEIWVESEYGLGTEFTIKLPAKVLNNNRLEMHEETSSSIIERVNIEFSDIYSS
jgi:signal transduction histidine kinase